MTIDIVPEPKTIVFHQGELCVPIGTEGSETGIIISDEQAHPAASLIAERFKARIVSGEK